MPHNKLTFIINMKKFNFLTQSKNSPSTTENKYNKYQTYGSTLKEIGEGDLTKPYINSSLGGSSQYVRFGIDNLFPQLIDQMYFQSPLHSSIVDFQINATIGGGFEIVLPTTLRGSDKVDQLTFFRKIKAKKLIRGIALDLKTHRRVHFKVTKKGNEIVKFERVMPSKVRYNKDASKFWISEDWATLSDIKTYGAYDPTYAKEPEVQILSFIDIEGSPGQDVYPLDKTVSVFNWCYLDGQSANLQKDNIQRSIFGNLVIKRPNEFKSIEEFNIFKKGIESKKGEVVPVLLLSANGKENLPEVESFPANENDKAFENMDKRIDDKICQAHSINPSIMGIERPGALGSGSDIKESYPIWEKNVIMPFRETIEEVLDLIMEVFKMPGEFKLKEFSIIEGEIVENKEQESASNETTIEEILKPEND